MKELTRYAEYVGRGLLEDDIGKWVKFEEAEAAIKELEAENLGWGEIAASRQVAVVKWQNTCDEWEYLFALQEKELEALSKRSLFFCLSAIGFLSVVLLQASGVIPCMK